MMQTVEDLLGAVEALPAVRLDIDDDQRSAGIRVGARLVARIDLRRGSVLVNAAAERIPALRRRFPSSRPTANGILFDLTDAEAGSEALAAICRRVNVERLGPQLRVASP
jgi:hypothetical protein